jgi:hypothetical protein
MLIKSMYTKLKEILMNQSPLKTALSIVPLVILMLFIVSLLGVLFYLGLSTAITLPPILFYGVLLSLVFCLWLIFGV